ncbi:MAG: c-type cytochrome, partial [Gammaproteobacteria bacterium]|nr:c-type cytochrome [Gammaproteobacteria bacterium]
MPNNHTLVKTIFFCLLLTITNSSYALSSPTLDTIKLYKDNCAECHNAERLGGMGPALLPENLKRLRKKAAIDVIKNGRVATQMPAFKEKLNDKQIQSLVDFVYTPLKETPVWGMEEIKASQIIHNKESDLPNKPVFKVDDLLNLFLVVELGDHHVTLLDGDKLEPIHRFKSRFALHGGPKYSPDGRFVYFASRDGWIS